MEGTKFDTEVKKLDRFNLYMKDARTEIGIGVNELARRSGVSASLISRIETGKRGIPKFETLISLARHLGVQNIEMLLMAGHQISAQELKDLTPSKIGEKYITDEEWAMLNDVKTEAEKKEEAFQAAIADPELKRWYKELPNSEEEDLRKLRKMWEIITETK